jgi:hypothetical protein
MPITININSGEEREKLSEGVHAAVLADIVDLGVMDTAFGPKEKVRFVWLTSEADSEGRTKYAFQTFTKSLHEKATLTKTVKQLTTIPTTGSFDLESLLGTQARLVIQHNEGKEGKVYANVASILKPEAGKPRVAVPRDFERKPNANSPAMVGAREAGYVAAREAART